MASVRTVGLAVAMVIAMQAFSGPALAYRPFDSTDPAVADTGEVEIELSPASIRHSRSADTWIAPQLRLNYGFADNWEVVLEGQAEHSRGMSSTLLDNALSLKYVLREGFSRTKPGSAWPPSLAHSFRA
jgi:hypothetical protein